MEPRLSPIEPKWIASRVQHAPWMLERIGKEWKADKVTLESHFLVLKEVLWASRCHLRNENPISLGR